MTSLAAMNPMPHHSQSTPARPTHQSTGRVAAAVRRMSWAYLIVMLAYWALIRFQADRWWVATLMLFGPNWVFLLPLAVLLPGAAIFRRRSLIVLLAASFIGVFFVLGLCLPWRAVLMGKGRGAPIRLVTCNVHGKTALSHLISQYDPDIVFMQESSPQKTIPTVGRGPWYVRTDGELTIASRFPIIRCIPYTSQIESRWGGSLARYDLAGPDGPLVVFNLHMASPHNTFDAMKLGHPGAPQRLEQYLAIRAMQSNFASHRAAEAGSAVILAGDFNTLCEGRIYRSNWTGYADAFMTAGLGLGRTYIAHGAAVRIDHIFTGSAWRTGRCQVGPGFVGTAHRPVIAELAPAQ